MNKQITIAIDGFSSTGKSTLAKDLAQKLNYIYVDTGAMYRAVTLFAMRNNCISEGFFDKKKLIDLLPNIYLVFVYNPKLGYSEIELNGVSVENSIRSIAVSNLVSKIAEISEVRSKLVEQQKTMGKNKGIVMDGRDIGTVVFPDAELKIFMTAQAQIRAQRRLEELKNKGVDVNFETVFKNVEERDYLDTHREDSPLVKAADAIVLDNSNLNKEQQFEQILQWVEKKIKSY